MPSLSKELRSKLANQTLAARECAEQGALAALENLAVHEANARPHMSAEQKDLRNRLRARGRAAGDVRDIGKSGFGEFFLQGFSPVGIGIDQDNF